MNENRWYFVSIQRFEIVEAWKECFSHMMWKKDLSSNWIIKCSESLKKHGLNLFLNALKEITIMNIKCYKIPLRNWKVSSINNFDFMNSVIKRLWCNSFVGNCALYQFNYALQDSMTYLVSGVNTTLTILLIY